MTKTAIILLWLSVAFAALAFYPQLSQLGLLLVAANAIVGTYLLSRKPRESRAANPQEQQRIEMERDHQHALDRIVDAVDAIRSPLNAILIFADIVNGEHVDDHKAKVYLREIQSSAIQLAALTRNMLNLSAIGSGVSYYGVVERININLLLEKTVNRNRPLAQHKGIQLHLHFPEVNIFVMAPLDGIERAIANILDNAVKYTSGGQIKVNLARSLSGVAEITVEDSGSGISVEDLPRIFDRFFRGQKRWDTHPDGSGLGLSVAKNVIESCGGSIAVESEENHGTTVTIHLPCDN
ncbi:MAG: HAMP domain-containing histidine kinase [Anaerolineae bacterium]|nr:HAMP domain-containing histidine kinase [Anaerolineae bacterium]